MAATVFHRTQRFHWKSSLENTVFQTSMSDPQTLERWLRQRIVLSGKGQRGEHQDVYMRGIWSVEKLGLGFKTNFGIK